MDTGLKLQCGSNRFDRARELRQKPVAGVLHDAAAVISNSGLDTTRQKHCQFGVRSFFVIVHEPRIASHVGGQYRRQSALDPDWPFLHHGPQSNQSIPYDGLAAPPTCFGEIPKAEVGYWHV
jgi:hypothetical protein